MGRQPSTAQIKFGYLRIYCSTLLVQPPMNRLITALFLVPSLIFPVITAGTY